MLALRVHLQHYAVGCHRQVLALSVPIVYEVIYLVEGSHFPHSLAYLESPSASRLQVLVVSVAWHLFAQEIIKVCVELATGYESRVLALQCSACSIARIGKQRFLCFLPLCVEPLKHLPWHQYLAPYLKLLRIVVAGEHERYAAYGAHVGCHVVAVHSVAACHSAHQSAVLVGKAY